MKRSAGIGLAMALGSLTLPVTGMAATEFSGYVRSGAGTADGNGRQSCFQLPGARSKYRLG